MRDQPSPAKKVSGTFVLEKHAAGELLLELPVRAAIRVGERGGIIGCAIGLQRLAVTQAVENIPPIDRPARAGDGDYRAAWIGQSIDVLAWRGGPEYTHFP